LCHIGEITMRLQRTVVFFAGYKDPSGGTLSIKELEKPQRITESQYVEGYVKVYNSKTFTLYSGRSVCSEFPTSGAVVA